MMISVLIVEDDPMVAELNRLYTEKIDGFHVIKIVNNGRDAIDFLSNHSVHLVLLDVFMPHMQGLAVLKKIKSLFSDVNVIMITANRASLDIKTALNHGVIDYIVKPFTFERFQSTLLAFSQRYKILHSEEELTQSALDKIISIDIPKLQSQHPKGINEQTLLTIKKLIKNFTHTFTVAEIADISGLSRISLKKYLDYLENQGELESELLYSTMGRPAKLYKISN